jgi:hypothetical protein
MAESYESKKQGVKGFLGNKYLCFQQLKKIANTCRKPSKSTQNRLWKALTGFD